MRYSSIVFLLVLLPSLSFAAEPRTRPLDPIAAEIFARSLDRSPSVQALVRQIEASDLIVHIDTSRELPAGVAGMTRFVTKSGGHRYLRVTVSQLLNWQSRVAILAHELKHACEVASSTAEDAAGMKRLFESAGFRPQLGRDVFETDAAMHIEALVRMELRDRTLTTRSTSRQEALPDKDHLPTRGASRQEF